ncbi:MAG: hypothetical protein KF887_12035 [Paracoccaceae bacterium]|nr:MAG: hypothetical protein KF887_12035 [Paracoccaceae bacterium]
MADGLPPIAFYLNDSGAPVIMVAREPVDNLPEVLARVPDLADPHWIKVYARVVNHLTYGYDYEMIMDPAAFEAEYRAAWAAEPETVPEDTPVAPVRLRDMGMPEFGMIRPPEKVDGNLVFYVRSGFYRIPYQVVVTPDGQATYVPVPMRE